MIANACVVFKNDWSRTYDPALYMPEYEKMGKFVREYDLENLE